jgi:hypothetical protein
MQYEPSGDYVEKRHSSWADEGGMISISHWGMFEIPAPRFIISAEIAAELEKHRAEWNKPDAYIEFRRA